MIPTFLLCKEIKKYCKVALGGDGADELFGGYSHYNRYNSLTKLQKFYQTHSFFFSQFSFISFAKVLKEEIIRFIWKRY